MTRRLTTVLFTDIVGSTSRVEELGDEAWAGLLRRHHSILRAEIEHFEGREIKTTGDGILAVFRAPAKAVRCATAIRDALRTLGLEIRAGVHTGEIEEDSEDVSGVGVHIAARVLAAAEPGEILVSRTVRDVVRGAGMTFVERGTRRLRGVEGEWNLYAVASEEEPAGVPTWGRFPELPSWLSTRLGWAIGAAALLLFFVIAAFVVGDLVGPEPGAGDYEAVAVLPFDNLSADPDDEYFSDGMTEDIITRLSKLGAFDVISRTSVMQYKDTDRSLREIGRELGVDAIVEGSVRRSGERVRVSAQLVDARTDANLWAESYDRGLADVFAVQSEIAGRVAGALEKALEIDDGVRPARTPTRDVEAYDFYLRARDEYGEYTDPANERAIELFRRAIDRDPNYAEAWAGLADAYGQEALRFIPREASVWADSAIAAARRAIELAPDVAEGYRALGLAYYAAGRMEESLRASREAVERNPGYEPAVSNVGGSLMTMGQLDESLPWLRRARSLNPLSVMGDLHLMEAYWRFQDDARVDSLLSRAEEMHSGHPEVVGRRIRVELGRGRTDRAMAVVGTVDVASAPRFLRQIVGAARLVAGDAEGAASVLEPFEFFPTVDTPQFEVSGPPFLALALRESGEPDRAADLLDRLEADLRVRSVRNSRYSLRLDLARVLALQGQVDDALEWFQRAVDTGFRNVRLARWDPTLEPLRGHDGFERALVDLDARIDVMRRRVEEARGS